jgi:glycosyltransferase involved in cell wall biosynthesis
MESGRPLRLLIMTDTAILGPGGSERFLRNLLNGLPRERYAIDVLQLSPPPDSQRRVARLDGARLEYRPVDAVYAPRGWAAFRDVRRRVLRGDYDIVQSQHEKSDILCALLPRRRGVRRISNRRDMGFQKSARVRALFRRANGRFDRIVAPARSIVEALVREENAAVAACRAIPNGVDAQRFRPADADTRARLRAALGFGEDDCLIGCVASFTPVKRHDVLVDAFATLWARQPRAYLLLVGDGPLRGAIEARISAAGIGTRVRLLGARADVEQFLPALDVFALASRTEGMSNAILEAQACGLPVVATDVGGNGELVADGATGLLVPAGDAAALAHALGLLAGDPARRAALGAAARARVERELSLDAMVAAYDALYRELADAR